MTDTVLCQIIQKQVEETLAKNKDAITDALSGGIGNDTQPIMEVVVKLSMNAVRLSTLMAVQMTLRMLEKAEVIDLADDYGPLLKVIPGGKEDK